MTTSTEAGVDPLKRIYHRGSIQLGLPLMIVAVLGGIALANRWEALPPWLAYGLTVAVGSCAIAGLALRGKAGGMGSNARFDDR